MIDEIIITKNDRFQTFTELVRINRMVKSCPTYLEGAPIMKLKTIDFATMKEYHDKKKNEELSKLKKMAKGNATYRKLLKVFNDKYEELTGRKFSYQKKRIRYVEANGEKEASIISSDAKRLSEVFKSIEALTSDIMISSQIIKDIIDQWSEWDKASPANLIGFLERNCKEDLGVHYMKLKKKSGKNILDESKRISNVEKHRSLFAS